MPLIFRWKIIFIVSYQTMKYKFNYTPLVKFLKFTFKVPQNMEKISLILYKKAKNAINYALYHKNALLLVENSHLVQELWLNWGKIFILGWDII